MAVVQSLEVAVELTGKDLSQVLRCVTLAGPQMRGLIQEALDYCTALSEGRCRQLPYSVSLGLVGTDEAWEPRRPLNPHHNWIIRLEKEAIRRSGAWDFGTDAMYLAGDGETAVILSDAYGRLHLDLSELFFPFPGKSVCHCFGRPDNDYDEIGSTINTTNPHCCCCIM